MSRRHGERSGISVFLLVSGLACVAQCATAAAQTFTAVDLGTLGGVNSRVYAFKNGRVVGSANTRDGATHAFLWTQGGGMVDLGTLGGSNSRARAVADNGEVGGSADIDGDGTFHAFGWTQAGGMVDLGTLAGFPRSEANSVSNDQVAGVAYSADEKSRRAFSWTRNTGMIDLGTLGGTNSTALAVSNGQVVGYSDTIGDLATHAFSWTQVGGMVDLGTLGAFDPSASSKAVSVDNGMVVGWAYGDVYLYHAFSWTQVGGMIDLGTTGGDYSDAYALSGGQIVGYTNWDALPGFASHAFSWTSTSGMVDLGTLAGYRDSFASAVDQGQVVGFVSDVATPHHAFSWRKAGGMVDLGTLGGYASEAVAVSSGAVAGVAQTTGNAASHAVLWVPYNGTTPTPTPPFTPAPANRGCTGDCRGDGSVDVSDLLLLVRIAIGGVPLAACPSGDVDGSGTVTVTGILQAVNAALLGCGFAIATPTARALGEPCDTDADCRSGFCTNRLCCATASCPSPQRCDIDGFEGHCSPPLSRLAPCVSTTDCATGWVCFLLECLPERTPTPTRGATSLIPGDACNHTEECPPGFVCGSEGVCCNEVGCPDTFSCRVPSSSGFCTRLPSPDSCTTDDQCAPRFCTDGVCCNNSPCPTPGDRCDIFQSKGTCTSPGDVFAPCEKNTDCNLLLWCDPSSNTCVIPPVTPAPNGSRCFGAAQCSSTFCVDQACCAVASCPTHYSCGIFDSLGRCAPLRGTGEQCQADQDCASGNCEAGVICNAPRTPTPPLTITPTPGLAATPNGQFLCTAPGGVAPDGKACNGDDDCAPTGVCVIAQPVCNGGTQDGAYCGCIGVNCVATSPACDAADSLPGVCPSGPNATECCDPTTNCADNAPCIGAQKVCLGGVFKNVSCLNDGHCPGSVCRSTGRFCNGGYLDSFSCLDDADCTNATSSGTCTASSPRPPAPR